MAHSASTGAAKRTVNVIGKRLGIKRFGSEIVNAGEIIVRQRGSEFYPGKNTSQGRDFTIYAKIKGAVSFRRMSGYKRNQKYIDILPVEVKAEKPAKPTKLVEVEVKAEVVEKAPKAKKPAAKTATTKKSTKTAK